MLLPKTRPLELAWIDLLYISEFHHGHSCPIDSRNFISHLSYLP